MTSQQAKLLAFIKKYCADRGYLPSYDECMAHMGIASKSDIARLVDALVAHWHLRRTGDRKRCLEPMISGPGTGRFAVSDLRDTVCSDLQRALKDQDTMTKHLIATTVQASINNFFRTH